MTRYGKMSHDEFIAYLREYMIDGCHPQICTEAADRLMLLSNDDARLLTACKQLKLTCADLMRCKEALIKQTPHPTGDKFIGKCVCGKKVYPHMLYCDQCGQALKWKEEK